jgi:hypothetical protein
MFMDALPTVERSSGQLAATAIRVAQEVHRKVQIHRAIGGKLALFFRVKVTEGKGINRKFVMPESPPVKEIMASHASAPHPSGTAGELLCLIGSIPA